MFIARRTEISTDKILIYPLFSMGPPKRDSATGRWQCLAKPASLSPAWERLAKISPDDVVEKSGTGRPTEKSHFSGGKKPISPFPNFPSH